MNVPKSKFSTHGLFARPFNDIAEESKVNAQSLLSGQYVYRCNSEVTNIKEPWQKICLESGNVLINCERYSEVHKTHMWVQSLAIDGEIRDFQIQWRQYLDDRDSVFEADYQFDEDGVEIRRLIDGEESRFNHKFEGRRLICSPLMRIYVGDTISSLLAGGGSGDVLMPWIQDPKNKQRLLEAQISKRSVIDLGEDSIDSEGVKLNTHCYSYRGDQYDASANFWLDTSNLLRRYCWQQNDLLWDVELQMNQSTC